MQATTIAQHKLLQHINENFYPGSVNVTKIDGETVRIEDCTGVAGYLMYKDGKIIFEDAEE